MSEFSVRAEINRLEKLGIYCQVRAAVEVDPLQILTLRSLVGQAAVRDFEKSFVGLHRKEARDR